MQRRTFFLSRWVGLVAVTLAACTAGDPRFTVNEPAGFLDGLWHGLISLATLVISLFSDEVAFYEVDNIGWNYDAGFLLGVLLIASFVTTGICARRWPSKERMS
jgi:hypothetical protein